MKDLKKYIRKILAEQVLEEDYYSIKEISDLSTQVLLHIAQVNMESLKRQIELGDDISYFNPIMLLDVYQKNPKKYPTLEEFITNSRIFVNISRHSSEKTRGSYTHIKEPEYDRETMRDITLYPKKDFFKEITEEFKKERQYPISAEDLYFKLWYAFNSTLEHEIQHAYDDFRSNSKLFQARKTKDYMKKHTMANGREANYADPERNIRKYKEYLKLQHEIWARFTQAISKTHFTTGDFAKTEDGVDYIHSTMKPLGDVLKKFRYNFDAWEIMPDSVKKKLYARVSAYWHKEQENLDQKNKNNIEREREALKRKQLAEVRKFIRTSLLENEGEYRGAHVMKKDSTSSPLYDLLQSGQVARDFYDEIRHYAYLNDKADQESVSVIRYARNKPDAIVTIYRAVPKGVKEINPGDWISLSKTYAKEHGMHHEDPKLDMPVISKKVKASDVWWDGNDVNESSYFPSSINENYEADVAIENVLHKALGDYFLENRDEILDNVYSTLSSRTANWAVDQLIEEYPDLESYRLEFISAAVKEGYFEMTPQKWESGELDENVIEEAPLRMESLPSTTGLFIMDKGVTIMMSLYDPESNKCYGYLTATDSMEGSNDYSVMSVAAEKGFGPFVYELAMMYVNAKGKGLTPSRDGDVRGDAFDVWAKFYDRKDVKKNKLTPDSPGFKFAILFDDDEMEDVDDVFEFYRELSKEDKRILSIFNSVYFLSPNDVFNTLIKNAYICKEKNADCQGMAMKQASKLWNEKYDE